ncbi:MAG: zinc metalloprotease HtpX [Deltaproteobacteria bacterium]|jgi:heat shock protein HtpX|nr:zinc metalloprotease HtpX [Deltaproteobacteria bacterium]MCL5880405.1 zinc metalloprotease HtpX [Deltaproteobacteria bacterium]MDA8303667.1 zinc metalloprotease HtpX [Deltaproteobacteria bacterium]
MNYFKTFILMMLLTVILIAAGGVLGGTQGMIIALIFAAIMNIGTYWFSDKMVLSMYHATPVTEAEQPELYSIVRNLAVRGNIPMPKVYIVDEDTPNAFATGRNPQHAAVCVTTGIMRILNNNELSGVIGHELTHVKNRDILISSIAATVAGAISMLAWMAEWGAMFTGFGGRSNDREGNIVGLIVMAILAPLIATLIQLAISRQREYAADKGGAGLSGNPLYLASALNKLEAGNEEEPMPANQVTHATAHMFIVNPLRSGAFKSLFSTHPPTEDRIKKLKEMARGVA